MIKGKILISLLTGAITLTSAGMATIITNPSASSEWLSQRFSAFNHQESAEAGENKQDDWFDTTVPDEATLLVVTPAPTTDANASASTDYDDDRDEAEEPENGYLDPTDVVASASIPSGESGNTGTSGSTSSVDVVASASIPSGESGYTGTSGSTSSVDVVASASKPGSSAPVSMEGLISLEEAIKFARAVVGDAVYKGYEIDDDYPIVYELYFVSGNTGYEIEILAANGEILDVDRETAYLDERDDDDDDDDDDRDDDDHDDDDDDDDKDGDDQDDDDDEEEDDD